MKTIILLFTLCLFAPILSQSQVYRCASTLNETNLCFKTVRDHLDIVFYVGGCAEDEYCPSTHEPAYCTKRVQKKEHGETCSANADCKSDLCEDGKCFRLEDGELCRGHANCGNFSFCDDDSKTCKPLVNEGESCASNFECGFDLVCSDRKCQKMFSIENGEPSDNYFACKSGFAYEFEKPEGNDKYCAEKKQLTPACLEIYKETCDFKYTSGETTVVFHEWCLPNWDYKPYCEESTGNKFWKAFIETYEEEKKKIDPTKIKVTDLRPLYWSKKSKRALMNYVYHARLLGAEKCVYDYFELDHTTVFNYFLQ